MEEEKNKELFEKYKIVVAARNFHYDNFNKWMTYFYVAIAALFLVYFEITDDNQTHSIKSIFISLGGYIVSLLFYWSSKGYYYWNVHWISLVHYYEKFLLKWKVEESIYRVFYNKKLNNNNISPFSGSNFSTSKLTLFFSFLIAVGWGVLIITDWNKKANFCDMWIFELLSVLLSIGFTLLITCLMKCGPFFSNMDEIADLSKGNNFENKSS